jgi:hypothetical protein
MHALHDFQGPPHRLHRQPATPDAPRDANLALVRLGPHRLLAFEGRRVAELMWDVDVSVLPVAAARESSVAHRLVSSVMTAVPDGARGAATATTRIACVLLPLLSILELGCGA